MEGNGELNTSTIVEKLGRDESKGKPEPKDWGLPGELTKEEVDTYMRFREEVETRGGEFKKTVFCFGDIEDEAYCLCRWLRARKFVFDDVITMIEEATQTRASARERDFYPDPEEALGVHPVIYESLYPQLYTEGNCKAGCPIFISKPGVLNVDGMECVTSLEGILKFHWFVMMHDFNARLKENKEKNPDFQRFECMTILDLEGLTLTQLSSRALGIIKEQTAVDSICFPETMNHMVIINAPRFFTATWSLIKGWIDPRTVGKIDMISSRKSWEKKLKELVDEDKLPKDYGGQAEDTMVTLMRKAPEGTTRMASELFHFRTSHSHKFEVKAGEYVEITIYTRATAGAKWTVSNAEEKKGTPFVSSVNVVHTGHATEGTSTRVKLNEGRRIQGPVQVKVKAESNSGRMSGSEKFLVVYEVFDSA